MVLDPTWPDIFIRLALTIVAGALIGYDRGTKGHAAGLRTTILVGLAASIAMIQANMLLSMDGKTSDSFVSTDVMRLPLGILTGVGFIGGGTILRKGNLIAGVTTAATLWLVTVIGLCFGGGQIALGCLGTAFGFAALTALKWIDERIPREHRGQLEITLSHDTSPTHIGTLIAPLGYEAHLLARRTHPETDETTFTYEIRWKRPESGSAPHDLLSELEALHRPYSFRITG
jgi:putative Mg2+ transporter-C (MgtC) family protein